MATSARTELPTGSKGALVNRARLLPVTTELAVGFPLGGSTFRALLVDKDGNVLDRVEIPDPSSLFDDIEHAIAAVYILFGCRPLVGAASIAGPVPARGLLKFTNIPSWPEFDRNGPMNLFGTKLEWFNDGPAGYFGVPELSEDNFAILHRGDFQDGDPYGYAIFGTGLNLGTEKGREDGHGLFAARSKLQWEYFLFLQSLLGHDPDWEDATSGGRGFNHAGMFFIAQMSTEERTTDPFVRAFESSDEDHRGYVVTQYALQGHAIALSTATLVFDIMGSWLGSLAVTSQVRRIDISEGILGKDAKLRDFVLTRTNFLRYYLSQGRFSNDPQRCTLRVCLVNPEQLGAVARATELLRAA